MNLVKEKWTTNDYQKFIDYLKSLQDEKYRQFNQRLLKDPTLKLIGIKTPTLKKIAKDITKGNYTSFISVRKNYYYEEIIIYGFIITNLKILNKELLSHLNNYLNLITNWATCDLFCSNFKIVKKNQDYFLKYLEEKIKEPNPWVKRFVIVTLLNYYLEKPYLKKVFILLNTYNTEDYYVNMATAWLLSISYIKNKQQTITYLKNSNLNNFTYNKTIQKIIESTRISKEEKEELKLLKKSSTKISKVLPKTLVE